MGPFAVLEAGEPPPRGQWENPRRGACVCCPLVNTWSYCMSHQAVLPGFSLCRCPSPTLPHPVGPARARHPGCSKAGARPGSRLVGLGLLRPAFINPPQKWCPRNRDPSRKACPPLPGMGLCSACPHLLLGVHEPGRTCALPSTHPPGGPAVGPQPRPLLCGQLTSSHPQHLGDQGPRGDQ